jgi:hypothetical protein
MRKAFINRPLPPWLESITSESKFDRKDVLENSIFYPGSRLDGRPFEEYSGFFHSFVYVDYEQKKDQLLECLYKIRGYSPLLIKDVRQTEISPNPKIAIVPKRHELIGGFDDESISEYFRRQRKFANESPYCVWAVLERKPATNPSHGPQRFSLLYIHGEGVATYQAIYNSNLLCPAAIILCLAEIGFGGNWTVFEQRDGVFERAVMSNSAGIPKYLFTWDDTYDISKQAIRKINGIDRHIYWEKYTKEIENTSHLRIWEADHLDGV